MHQPYGQLQIQHGFITNITQNKVKGKAVRTPLRHRGSSGIVSLIRNLALDGGEEL